MLIPGNASLKISREDALKANHEFRKTHNPFVASHGGQAAIDQTSVQAIEIDRKEFIHYFLKEHPTAAAFRDDLLKVLPNGLISVSKESWDALKRSLDEKIG